MRRHLDSETPKTTAEIQELAAQWKPGVATKKRKTTREKIEELFAEMSESDRSAAIEALLNQAAA